MRSIPLVKRPILRTKTRWYSCFLGLSSLLLQTSQSPRKSGGPGIKLKTSGTCADILYYCWVWRGFYWYFQPMFSQYQFYSIRIVTGPAPVPPNKNFPEVSSPHEIQTDYSDYKIILATVYLFNFATTLISTPSYAYAVFREIIDTNCRESCW